MKLYTNIILLGAEALHTLSPTIIPFNPGYNASDKVSALAQDYYISFTDQIYGLLQNEYSYMKQFNNGY